MPHFDSSMLLSGQYHQWLVGGFSPLIRLPVLAFVLVLSLAITVALLCLAPVALLRNTGQTYVEAIRNMPLLVYMPFWHFGVPQVLPEFVRDQLYSMNYEAASAVITFMLHTAAYMAKDIRSDTRSIPKKQLEASRVLGSSFLQAVRLVVLPQSLRVTASPLVNQTLSLWKNFSIAMMIGMAELVHQVQQVESTTLRGFEAFAFTIVAYLTTSIAITVFSAWYQHRYPVRTP